MVMEACGAAHHWARILTGLGHTVRLVAAETVRPFVKKGKKNLCGVFSYGGLTTRTTTVPVSLADITPHNYALAQHN